MPIRSRWTSQFKNSPNASNFHNRVREIFISDPLLKGFSAYQEVPVKDLCAGYPDNHFYDWYVEELNLIIELHGAQHYKVVNFGNTSYERAQQSFRQIQSRDHQKKSAALTGGYSYLEVGYKQYPKLDSKMLKNLMFNLE